MDRGIARKPTLSYLAWSPESARLADLQSKTALVTGGSRGPGFAVARELIAAGVRRGHLRPKRDHPGTGAQGIDA